MLIQMLSRTDQHAVLNAGKMVVTQADGTHPGSLTGLFAEVPAAPRGFNQPEAAPCSYRG
jgi:hypothetical protein